MNRHCTRLPSGCHVYFDSVWFRLSQNIPESVKKRWEKAGNVHVFNDSPNAYLPAYPAYLTIHQPTTKQLIAIRDEIQTHPLPARITQVHIKLEIPASSQWEAEQTREWVDRHIVKRNHRSGYVKRFKNTRYTGKRSSPSQIVTYDNRPSKIDGYYCVQIEWRFNGGKAVKQIGIYSIFDIGSFNFLHFLKRWLVLKEPDKRLIGRHYLKKQGKRESKYRQSYVGSIVVRNSSDKEQPETAEIMKAVKKIGLKTERLFRTVESVT